jgi:hypothetical protein
MLDEGYFVEYIDSDDEKESNDEILEEDHEDKPSDNPLAVKMREALVRMF